MRKRPQLPETLLKPLCEPFRSQADTLLDLYELTQGPGHPGRCVQCFFRLLGRAGSRERPLLAPLRGWIEAHIEIAVQEGMEERGRIPVVLEAGSLEGFCEDTIRRVRDEGRFQSSYVELNFRYRGGDWARGA